MLKSGRVNQAIQCLSVGIKKFSTHSNLWEELAAISDSEGLFEEAERAYQGLIDIGPPHAALAALRLGNLYARYSLVDQAIRYFSLAAELHPSSPVPHNNIGLQLMKRGDYEGALAAFEDGLAAAVPEDSSGIAMVLNNLGLLHRERGDSVAAADALLRAHSLSPSFESGTNHAVALLDAGRPAEALRAIKKAMKLGSSPSGAPTKQAAAAAAAVLAVALAMQDRIADAADVVRRHAASAPAAGNAHSLAAEVRPARLARAVRRHSAHRRGSAAVRAGCAATRELAVAMRAGGRCAPKRSGSAR
jgi:tetratricopeptide (TPR) repeat protein